MLLNVGGVPAGSLAAFDITSRGAVFYDESRNLLVHKRIDNQQEDKEYRIPHELDAQHYYWTCLGILQKSPNHIFAVLKNHSTKQFEFFLLQLVDDDAKLATVISKSITDLNPHGYEVALCQDEDSVFTVCFSSRKDSRTFAKFRRSSDKELFRLQVSKEHQRQSSDSSEGSLSMCTVSRSVSTEDSEQIKNIWNGMVRVRFPQLSSIKYTRLSVGRSQFHVKLCKPSLQSPLPITYKALTKFSFSSEAIGPVYVGGHAFCVSRNPSELISFDLIEEPSWSILSTIYNYRRSSGKSDARRSHHISVFALKNGPPADVECTWSNLVVHKETINLVVQRGSGQISLYRLNGVQDVGHNGVWESQEVPYQLPENVLANKLQFRILTMDASVVGALRGRYENESNHTVTQFCCTFLIA